MENSIMRGIFWKLYFPLNTRTNLVAVVGSRNLGTWFASERIGISFPFPAEVEYK